MRNIPNSGYCLILTFLQRLCSVPLWSLICVFALCRTKLYALFLVGGVASHTSRLFMSNPLWVCLFLSVCLSLFPVPPSWAPSQDIFPPECPTHVGSMSVSSRPSPHHHHTLDALWLPLQRAAWRHQWVHLLWSQSPYLSPFLVVCRDLWFIALTHLLLCCRHFLYSSNFTLILLCGERKTCYDLSLFMLSDFVVDQTQAVKFALDIACGMAFLHTLEPMIPRHYLNSKSVMVRRSWGFRIAFRTVSICHIWWLTYQSKLCCLKNRKLQKKEVMSVTL